MGSINAHWIDGAGHSRDTSVTIQDGDNSKPLVILLHGANGSGADMSSPQTGPHKEYLYDVHTAVPASIDRGWHDYPNAGWWSIGALDGAAPGVGWTPFLSSNGFGTAYYDQTDPVGLLADPVRELHAVIETLQHQSPQRDWCLLADSRGGLLARRWLADIPASDASRSHLKAMLMLHTPNQGTSLANIVDAVAAAVTRAAGISPALRSVARSLNAMYQEPDMIEMAIDSDFLLKLAHDERIVGARNIPTYTWGGTFPCLVRVRNWAFTADSAIPHLVRPIPPKIMFHWNTVPQPVVNFPDGVAPIAGLGPELQDRHGDLLVTDERSHLAGETGHFTNQLSHADTLISPVLQHQVKEVLRTL